MDALRDVAFHHAVEQQMTAGLESLGLVERKRGVWTLTKEGRTRLVHGT
jgi:Mn-dependent DtxR family transcriptional regulator